MKKQTTKKLHLGKIRIARLNGSRQKMLKGGLAAPTTTVQSIGHICPTTTVLPTGPC